jgi:hypothetical protein
MVCNTEGTPERIVINVSELEQQEEVNFLFGFFSVLYLYTDWSRG